VYESLLHRGLLVAIANDAGEGYLANPALMEAVEQKVGLNRMVPLRHRLLRQPGGFEGGVLARKGLDPHDFSVPQRE
jgi:hypothetical protein